MHICTIVTGDCSDVVGNKASISVRELEPLHKVAYKLFGIFGKPKFIGSLQSVTRRVKAAEPLMQTRKAEILHVSSTIEGVANSWFPDTAISEQNVDRVRENCTAMLASIGEQLNHCAEAYKEIDCVRRWLRHQLKESQSAYTLRVKIDSGLLATALSTQFEILESLAGEFGRTVELVESAKDNASGCISKWFPTATSVLDKAIASASSNEAVLREQRSEVEDKRVYSVFVATAFTPSEVGIFVLPFQTHRGGPRRIVVETAGRMHAETLHKKWIELGHTTGYDPNESYKKPERRGTRDQNDSGSEDDGADGRCVGSINAAMGGNAKAATAKASTTPESEWWPPQQHEHTHWHFYGNEEQEWEEAGWQNPDEWQGEAADEFAAQSWRNFTDMNSTGEGVSSTTASLGLEVSHPSSFCRNVQFGC